jgi:class 3 adenylate cyclase
MAAPADERKPVTVLFADLVGSTELATRHDPEQLRAMLAAFFDEMREQIQAFGGSVEKYAGDAIMAVFGVPRVNEDDAERAVRAALGMRQSLADGDAEARNEIDAVRWPSIPAAASLLSYPGDRGLLAAFSAR